MSDAQAPSVARSAPRRMDAQLLQEALRDKGLTIESVAAQIGVGRNTPRRWLKGDVVPLLEPAQRLAELLDLTVDELWPASRAA